MEDQKRIRIKAPTDVDYEAMNSGNMRVALKNLTCIYLKKLAEKAVSEKDLKVQDAQIARFIIDSIKFLEERPEDKVKDEDFVDVSSQELYKQLQSIQKSDKKK